MFLNRAQRKTNSVLGTAWVPDSNEPNRLLVRFPRSPFPGRYNVWTTDYDRYSLVYSCTQIIPGFLKYELIWILARTKTLDASLVTQLKDQLTKADVSISDFEAPSQDC